MNFKQSVAVRVDAVFALFSCMKPARHRHLTQMKRIKSAVWRGFGDL